MSTSDARVPVPPDGVRPGQLGAIVLGRVIMGDIAATLVDLAMRKLLRVELDAGGDGGWRLASLGQSAPRHRLDSLLRYEEVLLGGLSDAGSLSSLATALPHTLDKTRSAIVHEAVHRGWLKHLQHDQRTEEGEALAGRVRVLRRDLRRLKNAGDTDALAGSLLPYALHFGLAEPGWDPLVRFAHDFAGTFADLPGWERPEHKRGEIDVDALSRPTIDEQIQSSMTGLGGAWLI